ncbi:polyribonucleotide nucleotidyltransferase [bacterium]|nr:polyribonucleotide nucleotidyltransferase [bacterium]
MAELLSTQLKKTVTLPFHGSEISFETGWVAKQAGGAVIVRAGETMVLVTVCRADAKPDQSFFPLTVEYQEKAYAAGKIPGGFFRREAKPSEGEILTCRLIDRPIRPLFPDGYYDEIQVICTVLSADGINSPDVLAICGASAALHISDIPFQGPIAGVRVGRLGGQFVINPSREDLARSDMDFIVAGTKDAIVMVEGAAQFVPEKDVVDALFFGHEEIKKLCALQEELRKQAGKAKMEVKLVTVPAEITARVKTLAYDQLKQALAILSKAERRDALSATTSSTLETLKLEFPEGERMIKNELERFAGEIMRNRVLDEKVRMDGRKFADIRPIECEVAVIPRAHGSALFTRGETQGFVTTTLGSSTDAQKIDGLTETAEKTFMLHYNFPPFSTGEVKNIRGTGRREIGHGVLAERALRAVVPQDKDFPFVIRIVSDITESNGSSSMATVCGGSMSLMDAGVKIKDPVAGVAMGLIKEGTRVAVLSDILGDEDHLGDMDFKVCGTKDGITALQMDIKCDGLDRNIMTTALDQACAGRLHILGEMAKAITKPREAMSQYAPQVEIMKIKPDKIREVIGPGGKMIKSIVEETGVKIDVSDDGTVKIFSTDRVQSMRAKEIILGIVEEAEVGKLYTGVVKRITDFGAFIEILPGVDGLLHISQIAAEGRVNQVTDVMREGEEVQVKVVEIDRQGRVRLSQKEMN